MSCGFDILGSYLSTGRTCEGLYTCLGAGWSGRYHSIIPCMSKGWYFFLCLDHFVTYAAVTAFCKSCLCTCRSYCLIYYKCMSCCFYIFSSCLPTGSTSECLYACLGTGWSCCYFAIIPCMFPYIYVYYSLYAINNRLNCYYGFSDRYSRHISIFIYRRNTLIPGYICELFILRILW